jgi:hypothetical protein
MILTAILLLPVAAVAQTYNANLNPGEVLPDPGPDGATGFAVVTFAGTTVNYSILVSGLGDITAAHIHEGAAGATGGVVVDLAASFVQGTAIGSTTADQATIDAIVANPAGYYVQVHTTDFAAGALRGQLFGESPAPDTLYFPVAAAIAGQAGTFFRSDARVLNLSGGEATVTLSYFAEGADGNTEPTATSEQTVAAGEQLVLDDYVNELFGVTDGKGAVVIEPDRAVKAWQRIYNDQRDAGEGTFGQFAMGMAMDYAYPMGVLPFLSNEDPATGAGFRANIGWFNPSQSPVTVTLRGWDTSGTLLGEVEHTAAGWAQEQVNVAALWPALADYGDFYVTYATDGGEHLFMYASVVDNVNGDAIYVPAASN